jgi:thioredoxin-like negative regulator of GroEL
MKKNIILFIFLLLNYVGYSQEYIDDSNFEDKINEKSAFDDDETNIVVVEFWAKFNEVNAFSDWDKVEGVKYYRVDISKAPQAKKEYRIRMAPTLIIFKDGINEESFKAGLDLECPVTLDELNEAIEEVKKAGQF